MKSKLKNKHVNVYISYPYKKMKMQEKFRRLGVTHYAKCFKPF